jgi:ribonuclease J
MHALIKPKFFMPIHGEATHLASHRALAMDLGMPSERIFISEIGKVLELSSKSAAFAGTVPSGSIMIDGYGVGDVGSVVLRDRLHLSEDGLIVVVTVVNDYNMTIATGPDIISRGLVYVKESEELLDDLKDLAYDVVSDALGGGIYDWAVIKNKLRDELSRRVYAKTKRKPMILPLIMTV